MEITPSIRDYISPQFFTQRSRGDYEYTDAALYLQDITPDFIAQRNIGGRTYYWEPARDVQLRAGHLAHSAKSDVEPGRAL